MPEPVQEHVPNEPVDNVTKLVVNDAAVPSIQRPIGGDSDAQAMLIGSLRSQIQDLFSQVTQLNNKLVQSYDRVSDLEDSLHVASANVRQSSVKISQLELERTQHLAALNTGLLVEKSHVTAELTRLMEKATEEAAQRGQAETARADIEKDLDDLSATLFQQANTMVAEARFARAQSERKVEDAELALKGAEDAVAMMQHQMQGMQVERERSEKTAEEMSALMGKGKWVERVSEASSPLVRLRSSHTPYQEFLLFVAHLRTIRPTSTSSPAISTLLSLPFLARILAEDSEPTVRLDLAPSLNWLSRRSVLAAINAGQLTIEPMSSANLLQESAAAQLSNPGANICCSLCGMPIFSNDGCSSPSSSRPPSHPLSRTSSSINTLSRSANLLFKKPLSYSATNSANNSPPASPRRSSYGSPPPQQQVYIFRLASTGSSTANLGVAMLPTSITASYSAPSTSTSSQSPHHLSQTSTQQQTRNTQSTIYPLCTPGWCLTRLRSTCSLWAFVRTGVIDKVWEEEVPMLPAYVPPKSVTDRPSGPDSVGLGKPPIPPRRRGLWGMASAFGERAASWGSEADKDKARSNPSPNTPDKEIERRLPPPPPAHPASPSASSKKPIMSSPPPLPKRAEGRGRTRSATISRSAAASPTPTAAAPVVKDPTPIVNGHLPAENAGHPNAEQSEKVNESTPPESGSSATDEREAEATTQPLPVDKGPSNSNHKPSDSILTSPLPSPTTDRRTSQDSFASAASEIPPSESTPSPDPAPDTTQEAVIPPPDSPKIQSSNPPPTPTQANTSTENASPSIPALHNDATKEVPSQTAPAVPPPLPRRAAARARVSSVIPPAPPVDPAIGSTAETAETKDTFNTLNDPVEKAAAKETLANHPVDTHESNNLSREITVASPESTQPASGSLFEQNEVIEDTKTSKINGKEAGTERDSTPSPTHEKPPSSPASTILGNHINGTVRDSTITIPSQTGEGADNEVYVGDTTWEERTWKELVKLKEDMFWARVGGLR